VRFSLKMISQNDLVSEIHDYSLEHEVHSRNKYISNKYIKLLHTSKLGLNTDQQLPETVQ